MTNITEIAKKANVSRTTVSRVLNNHPYVKPEKRDAVLKAMKELNYVPNFNAINLSRGRQMFSESLFLKSTIRFSVN